MSNKITRRDFLNGTQIAIGASIVGPNLACKKRGPKLSTDHFNLSPEYYPPAKTGLRGSHDGSWEAIHARVAGRKWPVTPPIEKYDLVVVGGGISGLASAYFYKKNKPDARILILDNHDDFGGHAKRNEFKVGETIRIGYGGTESIDTPSAYSQVAKDLLADIGVELQKFYQAFDQDLYRKNLGLSKGILFDKATFGEQKLVTGYNKVPWEKFAAEAPLSDQARKDLVRIWTDKRDYLPGLSNEEKIKKLRRVSYEAFLRDYAKVDPQVIDIYRRWGMSFWCVGIDEIPATLVQSYDGGMPGLNDTIKRVGHRGDEPYIFHFPDGNASVARLLVRSLIPEAVPGTTMEDVVTTRLDYSKLDRPGQNIRIRLNSTAVHATQTDNGVDITFARGQEAHTVRAKDCIMACYNAAIPHICPELPQTQKEALARAIKVPITYTKVLVPNWRAMAEQGVDFVYYTNGFFKQVELDYPVSLGDYKRAQTPNDPMILHMCYVPYIDGVQGPAQWQEGRKKLLMTPFAEFERQVKSQLDQALAPAGFDADRDIQAITVNRWPHGYAYNPDLIWEQDYAREEDKPWVKGRQPFGRISIANSDAGAAANTKCAIDQGYRAVQERLKA